MRVYATLHGMFFATLTFDNKIDSCFREQELSLVKKIVKEFSAPLIFIYHKIINR